MSIDVMLSRLQKVRRSTNNSWMACCPAHEDRTPSLSIRDNGDGRLLINCMAGCETEDVLAAIGMDWSDVMPEKTAPYSPPITQRVYSSDALKAIQFEARIVVIASYDMRNGKTLTAEDLARLETAIKRINTALEMVG